MTVICFNVNCTSSVLYIVLNTFLDSLINALLIVLLVLFKKTELVLLKPILIVIYDE